MPASEPDTVRIDVGPHSVRVPRVLALERFPRLAPKMGDVLRIDADPSALAGLSAPHDVAFFRQGVFDALSTGQLHVATTRPALVALRATLLACQPQDLDEMAQQLGDYVAKLDRMANMGSFGGGAGGGGLFGAAAAEPSLF